MLSRVPLTGSFPSSIPHLSRGPSAPQSRQASLAEGSVLTRCILLGPHCGRRMASVGGSALQEELRQDGTPGRRQRGGLWEDVLPSTRTSSFGNPHLHPCALAAGQDVGSRVPPFEPGRVLVRREAFHPGAAASLPRASLLGSRPCAQTTWMKEEHRQAWVWSKVSGDPESHH